MIPTPAAIPDVLAVRKTGNELPAFVFACEIDLGGERLVRTFLPKLETLHRLVMNWSGGADSVILVLTRGAKRAVAIDAFAEAAGISIVAAPLPALSGGTDGLRPVVDLLESVLARDVKSH
jgi:hypothetical protein